MGLLSSPLPQAIGPWCRGEWSLSGELGASTRQWPVLPPRMAYFGQYAAPDRPHCAKRRRMTVLAVGSI